MKRDVDLTKLKPDERAYTGNIQVLLNDLGNDQLTCDLFLNSDMNPMIRLSPSGDYQFISKKKHLAFSRISCIYTVNNQKRWIYHSLDIPRIKQPVDSNKLFNLGQLSIVWKVDDSQFNQKNDTAFGSEDKMKDIGTITIKPGKTAVPSSPQI
jgi:hypothetical protein